jgi:predicted transcriptional regulator
MTNNKIDNSTIVKIATVFQLTKEAMDLLLEINNLAIPASQNMVDRFTLIKSLKWTKPKVEKHIKELHLAGLITPHQIFKAGGLMVSIQTNDYISRKIEDKISKLQILLKSLK